MVVTYCIESRHVTQKVKVVTPLFLRCRISITVQDKRMVAMDVYSESSGLVTGNVYCLVKVIEKDERIIAAVHFKIKLFDFFLPV